MFLQSNCYSKDEFIDRIKTDDEFAKSGENLGPIYGKQWRNGLNGKCIYDRWVYENINGDQTKFQISDPNELKTNPDSRRLMVSAWNVGELDQMVLPPCHYGFQVYTREMSLKDEFIKRSGL